MKKQTEKKWTKKFEEREKNVKNNNYGITLIALVITIVLNAVAWSKAGNFLQKYKKTLANNTNLL